MRVGELVKKLAFITKWSMFEERLENTDQLVNDPQRLRAWSLNSFHSTWRSRRTLGWESFGSNPGENLAKLEQEDAVIPVGAVISWGSWKQTQQHQIQSIFSIITSSQFKQQNQLTDVPSMIGQNRKARNKVRKMTCRKPKDFLRKCCRGCEQIQ